MLKDTENDTVILTSVAAAMVLDRVIVGKALPKDAFKMKGKVPSADAATITPVLLVTADATLNIAS